MNLTDLKLIWRNLWKNSKLSAINIFGLSISLAVCALIGLYLHFEFSFDRLTPGHRDHFRLTTTFKYPNSPEATTALSSMMMGPYLQRQCSDILVQLRVIAGDQDFICRSDGKEIIIGKSLKVDSSFFVFFNQDLLYGNPFYVFSEPNNIVLTQPIAERLFGEINPVGKIVEQNFKLSTGLDTSVYYMVSGVVKAQLPNSHLQFDALTIIDDRYYQDWDQSNRWHGVVANTYFKIRPGVEKTKIENEFSDALKKEMPGSEMIGLGLQAFDEIHLGSMTLLYDVNNHLKSDRKYLIVLGSIAVFILLISSINFANLSTVLAIRRTRETGVRRVLGAGYGHVFWHFLKESLLMAILAGCLAWFWVKLLQNSFLKLLGRDLELSFPVTILIYFVGVVILLGFLSGIYPALQAARSSALQVIQGSHTSLSINRPFIRRLVVFQFVLSGILIIGSLICSQQLDFLKNKDLGFQYAQVLEFDIGDNNWMISPVMKKELSTIPGVTLVSSSDHSIGTIDDQNGVLVRDPETQQWQNFPMSIIRADHNYFDLYELQFVTGRPPTDIGTNNELEYVVNESFVKKVGWKNDPIGQEIIRAGLPDDMTGKVVGVIRDVHHNTLRHNIEPICIQASNLSSIISIRVEPTNINQILNKVQGIWSQYIKDKPFVYQFMDEHLAQIYQTESRLGHALFLATVLSIFIACLGLLALSAFITNQRTKEIGVRKVLGASIASVVALLAKDFLRLVLIAFIIACPLAYWLMDRWLQDFAYHIDIHWTVFVLAGMAAIMIAFFTVAFQSLKTALSNPVNSLRNH